MVNLEKIRTFITGKNEIERKQEMAANKIIRGKATVAALKERERQEIRLAQLKEKKFYEMQVKALNKPKPSKNNNMKYDMVGINSFLPNLNKNKKFKII